MMKKIILVLGVIFCVGVVGPKVIGKSVESEYESIAKRLAKHPSIEIVERSFSNKWFDGEAVTKYKFKDLPPEFTNFTVIVTEQLSYGPVIFNDSGLNMVLAHSSAAVSFSLPLEKGMKKEDKETLEKIIETLNDKLSISSVISYGMNYTTNIILDEIVYDQDGQQLNIGKIDSEFSLVDETELTGFFNWAGGNFNSIESAIEVAPVKMTFDQEVIDGDIYAGNGIMSGNMKALFSKIKASGANGSEIFTINNLSITANSTINNELIDIGVQYRAEQFKGVGQDLKSINVDIAFNKLDSKIILELNQAFGKFQQDPAAYPMEAITEIATKLLDNDPEIIINDLSVVTPQGKIKSNMAIAVDHTLYNTANPMSIIDALKASAEGNVPAPFLQQLGLEGMVKMYIEQGLIIRKNDDLSFAAQFAKGQLTVNGNILSL